MPAEEIFDAVVIGSGFGGSVMARELAAAGRSVLVLERGRPYPPGSFPRTPRELHEGFWAPEDGQFGMFDFWSFDNLDMLVSSGLGGGSLIYANVMLRKPERTFVRQDIGDGGYEDWPLTRADLEPHYDAVEAVQAPQRYPLGAGPAYRHTAKSLAMLEAANRLRLPATLPPLAVKFAAAEGESPVPGALIDDGSGNLHGLPRTTCRLVGECDLGCNYGAKNTLDFTFLTDAVRCGAEIRCCCEATVLSSLGPERGYRVGYVQHIAARGDHPSRLLDPVEEPRRIVRAREVVLSAGAVATPRLLLANRPGLPGLSPALGTRVSGNGDYLGFVRRARHGGRRGPPRYLNPSRGPVITTSIAVDEQASSTGRGFVIQDAGAPAFSEWMWQATELPGDVLRAARPWLQRLRDRLHGRRDSSSGGFAARLLGDAHASAAMLPLLGMGRDIPGGRYRLAEGGRLELDWQGEASERYFDDVRERMRDVAGAMGGELMTSPLDRLSRLISVHPVGGAPMSDDPRYGVVDPLGRVYGHEGLWIADGSVMPGPVGVNPSFTIAAIAHRSAEALLDSRSWPGQR